MLRGETLGAGSRMLGGRLYSGAGPRGPGNSRDSLPITETRVLDETIGARGRRATRERGRANTFQHSPEPPSRSVLATHLYTPATVPDKFSSLPVGRHRPEHISSQNRKPLEIVAKRTQRYIGRHHLPSTPEAQAIARLQAKSAPPVETAAVVSPDPAPREAKHRAVEPEVTETPPAPPLPSQRRRPARGVASVREQPAPRSTTAESKVATPRHSVTETPTSPNRLQRTQRRLVAAATAVVLAGIAISGGLAFLRNNTSGGTQLERSTTSVISLPEVPKPLEIPIIPLAEPCVISPQDGNQWGISANRTESALDDHRTIGGTTNIFAKIGAYDSRETSPDPDAAQAGDAFMCLTEPAIETVDRLQEPLGPNAPQAEIDAAEIINRLNSLGPMETQQVIEHYGSEIEALKKHIYNILNPKQESQTSYQAPLELTSNTVIAAEAAPTTAEAITTETITNETKATTIFTNVLNRVQSAFRRDPVAKGRKAIAGLAAEHQRRQKQPSFVI